MVGEYIRTSYLHQAFWTSSRSFSRYSRFRSWVNTANFSCLCGYALDSLSCRTIATEALLTGTTTLRPWSTAANSPSHHRSRFLGPLYSTYFLWRCQVFVIIIADSSRSWAFGRLIPSVISRVRSLKYASRHINCLARLTSVWNIAKFWFSLGLRPLVCCS